MVNITLDLSSLEPVATGTQQKEISREILPTSGRRRPSDDVAEPIVTGAAQLAWMLQLGLEVECSLLCILWGQPHHVGLVLKELDLVTHFRLPAHRILLQSIAKVYCDIGDVSWTTVLAAISELPQGFAECGGRQGLLEIFAHRSHYPPLDRDLEPFVAEYIRFLRAVALQRGIDPAQPIQRYHVGWGHLAKNKLAKYPHTTGQIRCPYCGKTADLAGRLEDETMKLKATPQRRNR